MFTDVYLKNIYFFIFVFQQSHNINRASFIILVFGPERGNDLHQVNFFLICFEHADPGISMRYSSEQYLVANGLKGTGVSCKHWEYGDSIFPG